MTTPYTIDASVFINAFNPTETRHSESRQLLAQRRGSDAVYAAVALRFGATLITLDREQHQRVAGLIPTQTPAEALAAEK